MIKLIRQLPLIVCLLFTTALIGCDKDNTNLPLSGRYIAEEGNIIAAITFKPVANGIGFNATITVYTNLHNSYQDVYSGGFPEGAWPDYTLNFGLPSVGNMGIDALSLHCVFQDQQNFTAECLTGQLPSQLHFRYNNRTLDENGDGIVDDNFFL